MELYKSCVYIMYAVKISVLHKIYVTIYTELEIRSVNRPKYFRKSHIKKKEGRIEEMKKGREERRERGWNKNISVHYSKKYRT